MSTYRALAQASAGGSIELISLCLGGALLARKSVLDKNACRSWSKAIFNLFLPSLLFVSILRTIHFAKTEQTEWGSEQLLVPPVWAILTLSASAIVGYAVTSLFARDCEEAVRRVLFISLLLGNANNLPILLINSLCENFGPLQEQDTCASRGTGYIALFISVWNAVMWTFVLSFLLNAPDSARLDEDQSDTHKLLIPFSREVEQQEQSEMEKEETSSQLALRNEPRTFCTRRDMLLSPPLVAILAAAAIANVPRLPELILSDEGVLKPVRRAIDLLGSIVVPGSSLIVGARLYAHLNRTRSSESCKKEDQLLRPTVIIGMVLTRFVLLPFVGRLLFRALQITSYVEDPLLSLYLLIPFFMPTASNSVVMVQMAAMRLPNVGERMEQALLTLIFWQYLVAPVFLTANMALDLLFVFGAETNNA